MIGNVVDFVGELLISAGKAMRSADVFSEVDAMGAAGLLPGRMESDGPMLADPLRIAPKFYGFAMARDDVRAALDEMPDSELIGIAALIIEGWTPILLKTQRAATDVDLLIAALRDRAAQFYVVETDANKPFLTDEHLHQTIFSAIRAYEGKTTK